MNRPVRNSIINKDGSFNVKRVGVPSELGKDFYHKLMKMSWKEYFFLFVTGYLFCNTFFATLYYLGGNNIINASPDSFWEAWLFSFQTSTTLGYGHFLPDSIFSNIVVIFDAISGILYVAIATGLAFSKFSRPTSRVLFTDNIILTTYNNRKTLTFRLGNTRASDIIDASINVVVVIPEISDEGTHLRKLHDLKLVRSRTPIFGISLMAMHIIDEDSPIYGMKMDEMHEKELVFIVSFTGIEAVFSQSVHARHMYTHQSVVNAKSFEDILLSNDKGENILDFSKFNKIIY